MATLLLDPQTTGLTGNTGLARRTSRVSITLTASNTTSPPINSSNCAGGLLCNTSGGAIVVTFFTASFKDGTLYQIYDKDGAAVSRTIGSMQACPLPDECFAAPVLVLVIASGTAAVELLLKS